MTSTSGLVFLQESQSISKPPYLKFQLFLLEHKNVNDLAVWDIIMDDPYIPLKQEGELIIPKSKKK
ncbi:UBN2 domain-containing protein [Gossypium australe]|uniref:UBN2 domain-containing protein n=1 Tax=Gossypium australe TaxID=47621 RepID=A0A5B6VZ06_9ROSI|nr:UBN2 domain-containing protein [Gossypium australe]